MSAAAGRETKWNVRPYWSRVAIVGAPGSSARTPTAIAPSLSPYVRVECMTIRGRAPVITCDGVGYVLYIHLYLR